MNKIAPVFLAFAVMLAVPAYADLIVEKPEMPKNYIQWPISVTASCKTQTKDIKLSLWIKGEDGGIPISPIIYKSFSLVLKVESDNEIYAFVYATAKNDPPYIEFYFRKGDNGWLKKVVMVDDRRTSRDEFNKMMEAEIMKFLDKIGIPADKILDTRMERLVLRCLEGAPQKQEVQKDILWETR